MLAAGRIEQSAKRVVTTCGLIILSAAVSFRVAIRSVVLCKGEQEN